MIVAAHNFIKIPGIGQGKRFPEGALFWNNIFKEEVHMVLIPRIIKYKLTRRAGRIALWYFIAMHGTG